MKKKYPRKSIYFENKDLIHKVEHVAKKLKRSFSYIVCRAVKKELKNFCNTKSK